MKHARTITEERRSANRAAAAKAIAKLPAEQRTASIQRMIDLRNKNLQR